MTTEYKVNVIKVRTIKVFKGLEPKNLRSLDY